MILDFDKPMRPQLRTMYDARTLSYPGLAGHAWIMSAPTCARLLRTRVAGPEMEVLGLPVVIDDDITDGRVYLVQPVGST